MSEAMPVKFCMHCGKGLPREVTFCPSCGKPQKLQPPPMEKETEQAEASYIWFILPILLGLLGGIIGYFFLRKTDKRMARNLLIIGAVMTVILWIAINGSFTPSTVQHVPTKKEISPVEYVFTGTGDKSTQTFYIPAREWGISYRVQADPDVAELTLLIIFVYPEGESVRYVDMITYQGIGLDHSTVHDGPGNYYLKVFSANCEWKIVVFAPY